MPRSRSTETRENVIRIARSVFAERFPDIPYYSLGYEERVDINDCDYVLESENSAGQPFIAIHGRNGATYFSVIADGRDPRKLDAHVILEKLTVGDDARMVMRLSEIATIQEFTERLRAEFEGFDPIQDAFRIVLRHSGDAEALFDAIPDEYGTRQDQNDVDDAAVLDQLAIVVATDEISALEKFASLGRRSDGFMDMIRAGIQLYATSTPKP